MHPFKEYLRQHNLEALTVSVIAKVRYTTVWNATKGNPITPDHAEKIRQAVAIRTGIPYTGPLAVIQPIEEQPTLPVHKISRIRLN